MVYTGIDYCRSKVKSYLAVAILFIWLPPSGNASVGVIVFTPNGIVVGTDSKAVLPNGQAAGTIQKVFLLHLRLITACTNLERVTKNDGTVLYDFPTWISQIDKNVNPKMSVAALANLVSDQMPKAFLETRIKNGVIAENSPGAGSMLFDCEVAGYERDNPMVYRITLKPNWKLKTVDGPTRELDFPQEGDDVNLVMLPFGPMFQHIMRGRETDTEENKWLVARIPDEYNAIIHGKPLSLKQAVKFARALIGVEAKFNPKFVGFPITVVTLPKTGNGWVRTYREDIPPLTKSPYRRRQKK
jgi:hypothetical protein